MTSVNSPLAGCADVINPHGHPANFGGQLSYQGNPNMQLAGGAGTAGLELLDMARDVAAFNLPARASRAAVNARLSASCTETMAL